MTSSVQAHADAASDSYANRSHNGIERQTEVSLDGQKYQVFGYANDPISGFHATAYKEVAPPHNIIIAYRGTDPGLLSGTTTAEKAGHALTTLQDVALDITMVWDRVNPQLQAADAFTRQMIDKARSQGIPSNYITVTGHSLGGTLAEIEAARFDLRGVTFNAFGAASLGYAVPADSDHVVDYVMAGDVVSAASRHHGQVITLTSPDDLELLRAGRYIDAPEHSRPNPLLSMSLGDHSIAHFTGPDSVLEPATQARFTKNYTENRHAVDAYRNDIRHSAAELSAVLKAANLPGIIGLQAGLPDDMQQQVDEYLAIHADPVIRNAIEQNTVVAGAEQMLQQSSDSLLEATRNHMPNNTLGVIGTAYVAQTVAERQLTAGVLRLGARQTSQIVESVVHSKTTQSVVVHATDGLADMYRVQEATGRAVEHLPDATALGIGATEYVVAKTHDALTHPEKGRHQSHKQDTAIQAATSHLPDRAHDDPRHPGNPNHALFNRLKQRFPEASDNRLLQFTAACHTHGINDRNLKDVHLDAQRGVISFGGRQEGQPFRGVRVDLKEASPPPAQSIQQIQQFDQQQAQIHALAQTTVKTQQAPLPVGP